MTLRTITFDDSTHKLVPREATSEIIRALESEIKDCGGFFVGFTYAWRKAVLAAPEYCDKSLYQEPEIDLASRDFYEVMQAYRHDKGTGSDSFEAVKQWLRNPVYLYQDTGKDE